MAWTTSSDVKAELAFRLKMDSVADLPSPDLIDAQVANAISDTFTQIQTRLLELGYSTSQITGWDEGSRFNRLQAVYVLMGALEHVESTDLWVEKLNLLKNWAPEQIPVSGVLVRPAQMGRVGQGDLATGANQMFSMDTRW